MDHILDRLNFILIKVLSILRQEKNLYKIQTDIILYNKTNIFIKFPFYKNKLGLKLIKILYITTHLKQGYHTVLNITFKYIKPNKFK